MYGIEPDKYYMIATSEHPLTAMYMDETIPEEQMPLRMVGVPSVSVGKSGATARATSVSGGASVHQD